TRFAVRLVKGAYWDYETTKSRQNGWDCPVYLEKPESDANFETLTRLLLENESIVTSAFGSHNVRSIAHAQALAEQLGIDRSRFEFQLLYGMAGPIKRALVEMGYRVREYCPVGELLPGMSYLVRRLLENTSNEGFLRAKFRSRSTAKRFGPTTCFPRSIRASQTKSSATLPKLAYPKLNAPSPLHGWHSRNGVALRLKNAVNCWNAPLKFSSAAGLSFPRSKSLRSVSHGLRRTATLPKPSIFVPSTPGRCA